MKNCLMLLTVLLMSTLALSVPLFAQWVQTNLPYSHTQVYALVSNSAFLFAGTYSSGVYRSSDSGATWTMVNNGLSSNNVYSLVVSDTNLFAGTDGGIYRSTNNGTSWVLTGFNTYYIAYALAVMDTNLFAGTQSGVNRSGDNGSSWSLNTCPCTYVSAFTFVGTSHGTNLYAGSRYNGVCLSTDNGITWTEVDTGLISKNVFALAAIFNQVPTDLFAGTLNGGIFRSVNNGQSWAALNSGLTSTSILALAVGGSYLFAGTAGWNSGNNIFLLTDIGTRWTSVSDGISTTSVTSVYMLTTVGNDLFAGTDDGVWRRPLSQMVPTGVKDDAPLLPKEFALEQNYPNPFNPTTSIRFALPKSSYVTLKTFNLLGQEVAALVNQELPAGYHEVTWDACKMPSGMYFYRLQTKEFTQTRKLLLLK